MKAMARFSKALRDLLPRTGRMIAENGAIAINFPLGLSFQAGTLVGALHTTDKAATVGCSWYGRLEPETITGV